jgi:alpha-tubulin suppressor-like RCC1 family protein
MVLNDKGDVLLWGKYLKDKIALKIEGKKSGASDIKSINKFPDSNKFEVLMESISTGPNHSASISVKKSLYTWGNGEGGRLGLTKDESEKAKNEPVAVSRLMNLLS